MSVESREYIIIHKYCRGLQQNPLAFLGAVIILFGVLVPFLLYYNSPESDGVVKGENGKINCCGSKKTILIPSISETWRNRRTYTTSLIALTTLLVVYNTCLQETWTIILFNIVIVLIILTYFINDNKDPYASLHAFFAGILFTGFLVICFLITKFYLNWSTLGLVFLPIISLSYAALMICMAQHTIRYRGEDKRWDWYIAVLEILYCIILCVFIICIN